MSTDNQNQHCEQLHGKLKSLFGNLARFISDRDAHYESSWKKRGGPGAFNTIARPWDRFEAIAKRNGQDIFKVIQEEIDQGKTENDDGTLQACVRDLLCYMALLMVETADMRKAYGLRTELREAYNGNPPKRQEPAHTTNSKAAEDIFPTSPKKQGQPSKAKVVLGYLIEERSKRVDKPTNLGLERDSLDCLLQLLYETL